MCTGQGKRKKGSNYKPMYYYLNKLMSFNPAKYYFYIVIGSRGRGKTVSAWRWVLKRYLKYGEQFVWLRLTDAPIKKMARNNSTTVCPAFLIKQLGIGGVFMKGSSIFAKIKKGDVYKTFQIGVMDSISSFHSTKGNDLSKFTNVVFDEINREVNERNTFDVARAFINQIENIARFRKIRVLMLGNTISDTSDILGLFNFQPKTFGIYKLTRRNAIIEYLDDSEDFKEERKKSLAGRLLEGVEEDISSSFTNKQVERLNNIRVYNREKPYFIYYVNENRPLGIYKTKKGEIYVGKVRDENLQKYKISPFLSCIGLYKNEVNEMFLELVSINRLLFESNYYRSIFIKALKNNKTSLY